MSYYIFDGFTRRAPGDHPTQRLYQWYPDARYSAGDQAVRHGLLFEAVHDSQNIDPVCNPAYWRVVGRA